MADSALLERWGLEKSFPGVHALQGVDFTVCAGEITPGSVQEYWVHRATSRKDPRTGEPSRPARSTLHHEIVTLHHVLKTAQRHGWLESIPNLSPPYKTSGKIAHRAWFSPSEYRQLYEATRERANHPKHPRHREASARLHDCVLFMANTGLRPDEARRLQFRDVAVVNDEATGERILPSTSSAQNSPCPGKRRRPTTGLSPGCSSFRCSALTPQGGNSAQRGQRAVQRLVLHRAWPGTRARSCSD